MKLITRDLGTKLIVQPDSSRLDAAQAGEFKQQMAALAEKGHAEVVVDLSSVNFVDSSGLSALISTMKMMGDDRSLALAGPSAPVLSLLKLTRFDRILRIYENAEDVETGPEQLAGV